MRVLIVVTHLLGTGHLSRALTLARAFADAGHTPLVVSGGFPAPHLQQADIPLHQLPPLRSDGTDFTQLLTPYGSVADEAYFTERQTQLIRHFAEFQPDILITELFPFGRRNLRAEFMALLETAAAECLVLSSIRDILAPPSKPSKVAFAQEVIAKHYAGVLVHSDPEIAPLELSWPDVNALSPYVHYTGFVAPPAMAPAMSRKSILVSSGGGAVGDHVFEVALQAARLRPDLAWTCLVGGDENRRARLASGAPDNVTIEDLSPDFRDRMAGAAASVSLAGYNTAMDLLQSGTPGVLVPFDAGNEVEQGIRAKALSGLPAIAVLKDAELNAASLAHALDTVLNVGPRKPRTTNMDGAARSVDICEALLAKVVHG